MYENPSIRLTEIAWEIVPLIEGKATYDVPADTVTILDLYVTANGVSRPLFPFSGDDYADLDVPNQRGVPTLFCFDRSIVPIFTLWPVPDADNTYTVRYCRIRDRKIAQGDNAELRHMN